MATLAGSTGSRPAILPTIEATQAESKLYIDRVNVHTADHKGQFVDRCMFCICRAVDSTETHDKREAEAHTFLAKQDLEFVIESIRQVRNWLGNECPAWMFKGEYLR